MRVHYHTFGCKANQYDTERMRQEIEALGGSTSDHPSEADVCVVNTCTVTNQADADARRYVRRLRRRHPDLRIVVAGCSAALRADHYRGLPEVSAVVRGHDRVEVARAALGAETPLVQLRVNAPLDRLHVEPVGGALLRERRGRSRGWLKIQDGCDRRCSFCATRLARGPSRSRHPEEVTAEAQLLAETHDEIVLTGIHIGHYGRDLDPAGSLSRLVAELLERTSVARFRLGSVEATEVDDLLVDLLADSDGRLARHLHMPLQSGSDSVLRRMRRWHTREAYRTRTLKIAERVPGLGLGADVIAGFPGEGAGDHEETVELIRELPFTYLHVFPYSPRSGTAAVQLDGSVPQRIAGERAREIRRLGQQKGARHRAARIHGSARVVLEGDGSAGLTGDYLRVEVRHRAETEGRGVHPGTLQGSVDSLYIVLAASKPVDEAPEAATPNAMAAPSALAHH